MSDTAPNETGGERRKKSPEEIEAAKQAARERAAAKRAEKEAAGGAPAAAAPGVVTPKAEAPAEPPAVGTGAPAPAAAETSPASAAGEAGERKKKTPEEIEAAKQAARERAAAKRAEKDGGAAPAAAAPAATAPTVAAAAPAAVATATPVAPARATPAAVVAKPAASVAPAPAAPPAPAPVKDPLEDLVVPGYVPLDQEMKDVIRHRRVRANEEWRPVLPGQNRQRKIWALRHVTAKRVFFVALCATLAMYFFLARNHIRFHDSYPVNFPDIEIAKDEVRRLGEWSDTIGNLRMKKSDAESLAAALHGFNAEQATEESLSTLTLAAVIDDIRDPLVADQARLAVEQIALVDREPLARIQRELRPALEGLSDAVDNRGLRKLVKLEAKRTVLARRDRAITRIRERDYELRRHYFELAHLKGPATLVFALSVALLLFGARLRWVFQPDMPAPKPDPMKGEEQQRIARLNRWSLLTVGLLIVAFAGFAVAATGSLALPGQGELERLAEIENVRKQREAEAAAKYIEWQKSPVTQELLAANAVHYRSGTMPGVRRERGISADLGEALWEAPLPLTGMSAPLIWSDPMVQVVVATVADASVHQVIAVDLNDGKERWNVVLERKGTMPDAAQVYDDDDTPDGIAYAAISPASDGRRVFTFWPNGDIIAQSMLDGGIQWRAQLRTTEIPYAWQTSALLVAADLLLVPLVDGAADSGVHAYDTSTGSKRWHVPIPGHSWTSPVLVEREGKMLLLMQGEHLHAIDIASGAELWHGDKSLESELGASPTTDGIRIYSGIKDKGLWAFGFDGKRQWEADEEHVTISDYPSFLTDGKYLWSFARDGNASAIDVSSGALVAKAKLDGDFWSSPMLIGDKIVLAAVDGTVHVRHAGPSLGELGTIMLDKGVYALPALSDSHLVFRTLGGLIAYPVGTAAEHAVEATAVAVADPVTSETPATVTTTTATGGKPEPPVAVVTDPLPPARTSPQIAGEGPILVAAAADAVDPTETDFGAKEWGGWRGPGGQGVAAEDLELPETWDPVTGTNIAWSAPLELPGMASPVVWGDRAVVFMGDANLRQMLCVNVRAGDKLWITDLPTRAGKPRKIIGSAKEDPQYPYMHAAATPVTDGEHVIALCTSGDLVCLGLADGQIRWARDLGVSSVKYGHSQSPVLYGGRLYVSWDQAKPGTGHISAYGIGTGKELWRVARDTGPSYATPIIAKTSKFGTRLVTMAGALIGYDIADGRETWRAGVFKGDIGVSPIFTQEKIYTGSAGPGSSFWALKTNAEGSLDEKAAAWTKDKSGMILPQYVSPVSDGALLWTVGPGPKGALSCRDVQTGAEFYTQELGQQHYASPVLIGKRLLLVSESGVCRWVPATTGYDVDEAGAMGEQVVASPAVTQHGLLIRSATKLTCIRGTD